MWVIDLDGRIVNLSLCIEIKFFTSTAKSGSERIFICAESLDRRELYKLSEHASKEEAKQAISNLWKKLNYA